MTDDDQWYYTISDRTVHQGKVAPALDRMGPYPTKEAAEQALRIAAARNKAADEQDEDWG